ncbi:uncharacterized protein LY79DRAFT_349459 [Colletotrichum navitas]|uniref:Uncharacterized protein n=1 Tax=Colletotrichum navitas TaxID=681940 RepID=A0AAD8VA62_9PEZI|nr:uncharacterized protein LY79DRAFT_349459 [Colletotrichum navitas]KAK1597591.1 hypothetical protein LY79DRAFT_349459 [Colletotrichum navitas]
MATSHKAKPSRSLLSSPSQDRLTQPLIQPAFQSLKVKNRAACASPSKPSSSQTEGARQDGDHVAPPLPNPAKPAFQQGHTLNYRHAATSDERGKEKEEERWVTPHHSANALAAQDIRTSSSPSPANFPIAHVVKQTQARWPTSTLAMPSDAEFQATGKAKMNGKIKVKNKNKGGGRPHSLEVCTCSLPALTIGHVRARRPNRP